MQQIVLLARKESHPEHPETTWDAALIVDGVFRQSIRTGLFTDALREAGIALGAVAKGATVVVEIKVTDGVPVK